MSGGKMPVTTSTLIAGVVSRKGASSSSSTSSCEDTFSPSADRMLPDHPFTQLVTDHGSVERREAAEPFRELVGVVPGEAQLRRQERLEDGARGQHRQAGGRRFVHNFVSCAGSHVVDQRVGTGQETRDL